MPESRPDSMPEPPRRGLSAEDEFYRRPLTAAEVAAGRHRDHVGGLWEELGTWQFDLLIADGLRPADRVLDLGCGCLRGGVRFVAWLEPGGYYGIDCNASLLDAGLAIELPRAGLEGRLAADHLLCNGDYDARPFAVQFDYVLAQSLWSHLPWDEVRRSLANTAVSVRPGGRLLATFFAAPSGEDSPSEIVHPPAGIRTSPRQDPFHHRVEDLVRAAAGTGWVFLDAAPARHPRGQWVSRWERRAAG
jgi:SAM-dependent methyltransferase